jgi:Popeye protein conserved region
VIDLCIHVANVLYLASFLGRDMLWLRILTCGGLVLGVVFFSCQPAPMYGPTAWHVLFLFINAVQIRRLIGERRRLMLTTKQERVGEATFHDLSREELLNLLTHVMSQAVEPPKSPDDIQETCHQPLSKQEGVLRDLAFNHLSRADLLNLLTRRMWNAIVRLSPARRSQHAGEDRAEKVA